MPIADKLIRILEERSSLLQDELSESLGTENEELIVEINTARIDEIDSLITEVKSLKEEE